MTCQKELKKIQDKIADCGAAAFKHVAKNEFFKTPVPSSPVQPQGQTTDAKPVSASSQSESKQKVDQTQTKSKSRGHEANNDVQRWAGRHPPQNDFDYDYLTHAVVYN